jgi:hypothetical protein
MNRKLVIGAVAGVAAVALAYGGTTYSAWSDFGDINNNQVGAGILKLDLASNSGGAAVPLEFGNLAPSWQLSAKQAIFVASNNGDSVPSADLFLTIKNVRNYENGCSSNSESVEDPQCASTVKNDGQQGGELSRVLNMMIESYAAPDEAACKGYVKTSPDAPGDLGPVLKASVLKNELGNLADPTQIGQKIQISGATPLEAGDGVCVVFNSYWPTSKAGGAYGTLPSDNTAQGDSLKFDAHFDLEQHIS